MNEPGMKLQEQQKKKNKIKLQPTTPKTSSLINMRTNLTTLALSSSSSSSSNSSAQTAQAGGAELLLSINISTSLSSTYSSSSSHYRSHQLPLPMPNHQYSHSHNSFSYQNDYTSTFTYSAAKEEKAIAIYENYKLLSNDSVISSLMHQPFYCCCYDCCSSSSCYSSSVEVPNNTNNRLFNNFTAPTLPSSLLTLPIKAEQVYDEKVNQKKKKLQIQRLIHYDSLNFNKSSRSSKSFRNNKGDDYDCDDDGSSLNKLLFLLFWVCSFFSITNITSFESLMRSSSSSYSYAPSSLLIQQQQRWRPLLQFRCCLSTNSASILWLQLLFYGLIMILVSPISSQIITPATMTQPNFINSEYSSNNMSYSSQFGNVFNSTDEFASIAWANKGKNL